LSGRRSLVLIAVASLLALVLLGVAAVALTQPLPRSVAASPDIQEVIGRHEQYKLIERHSLSAPSSRTSAQPAAS